MSKPTSAESDAATPAMIEDTLLPFSLPSAEAQAPVVRDYAETRYGTKSWHCQRRVAARIEATTKGLDIRYVVTTVARGSAEWLYDAPYCARGQRRT